MGNNHNEYKIPGRPEAQVERPIQPRVDERSYASPLKDALRLADSVHYTPEVHSKAFQVFRNFANENRSYRETALDLDKKNRRNGWTSFGWIKPALTEEELTERESSAIQKIYPQGKALNYRFWLAGKYFGSQRYNDDADHWFFTQEVQTLNAKNEELVIHYEVDDDNAFKWVDAKPYVLSMSESQTLGQLIERHLEVIREEIYPFEGNLHELQVEVDEDYIVEPNTEEAMFSKN